MKYEDIKQKVVRECTIHDGYFGKTKRVGLAYHPDGKAVFVADDGYFSASDPDYASESEMLYYFDNHLKAYFSNVVTVFHSLSVAIG